MKRVRAVGVCPNGGKQQFSSRAKARQKALYWRSTARIPDFKVHPYRCPHCGFWHVTSQEQR